mmetsp:Transcript_38979/g.61706  ORF Transcript_38979/g.61706 Transcript_38979/m.61706 type:complete len:196 (+) Transcript_38979:89-676(+)
MISNVAILLAAALSVPLRGSRISPAGSSVKKRVDEVPTLWSPEGDDSTSLVELNTSSAEDAECFCFADGVDFDEEREYSKASFETCSGITGSQSGRCNEFCETKPKYRVRLSGEGGTQTISYCQNDGDCKCLDVQESNKKTPWRQGITYKLYKTYKVTDSRHSQFLNLAWCYARCNTECKDIGWAKGSCVWPYSG